MEQDPELSTDSCWNRHSYRNRVHSTILESGHERHRGQLDS